MAVQTGFVGANPYSRTLIERIRLSKETQWRRLLIWGGAIFASCSAVGLLLPNGYYVPDRVMQASMAVLAGGAGFGAAAYCLAIFVLQRKIRPLFAATAFSAIGTGAILQVVVDLHGSPPAVHGWINTAAWLIAGLLLVGEAHAKSRWRVANKAQAVAQLLAAGFGVAAFPLAVLPHALDPSYLYRFSSSVPGAAACRLVDTALGILAAALISWALVANYRRYMKNADGLAGLLCYYLVACAIGLLFYSACADRFDRWHTMSQMAFIWSWLALVVGNGIENAFAHKEAHDQLHELEALHDVSWSLVGASNVTELLELFASTLVNKLGAGIAAVYLAKEGNALELGAVCGSDESKPGTRYPLVASGPWPGFHSGHTAKAFSSRQVQVAHDVFVDVEFVPWRVVAQDDGCAVSVPLVDHDECIGVLNTYFSDASQLTNARLRLLATIAAAATSAIEYALSKESAPSADCEELGRAA